MKNALILHGTNGTAQHNWFPWLKDVLENKGWKVFVPNLPGSDEPNLTRYNKFILEQNKWAINENSYLIGHSSGAMAVLGLLQVLPENVIVDTCILVGAFKDSLGEKYLERIFEDPFDFKKIKKHAKRIIFIHSDNDPYCPLEHAEYLSQQLDAELIVKPGQKHFSVGTFGEEYRKFHLILDLLNS